jgi:hypothetical protein
VGDDIDDRVQVGVLAVRRGLSGSTRSVNTRKPLWRWVPLSTSRSRFQSLRSDWLNCGGKLRSWLGGWRRILGTPKRGWLRYLNAQIRHGEADLAFVTAALDVMAVRGAENVLESDS